MHALMVIRGGPSPVQTGLHNWASKLEGPQYFFYSAVDPYSLTIILLDKKGPNQISEYTAFVKGKETCPHVSTSLYFTTLILSKAIFKSHTFPSMLRKFLSLTRPSNFF
jgi:hypothetical protein